MDACQSGALWEKPTNLRISVWAIPISVFALLLQFLCLWLLGPLAGAIPTLLLLSTVIVCGILGSRRGKRIDLRQPWALLAPIHIWFWIIGALLTMSQGNFSSLFSSQQLIDIRRVELVISVGFVCILVGYQAGLDLFRHRIKQIKHRRWDLDRVVVLVVGLYTVGTLGRYYDFFKRLNLPFIDYLYSGPPPAIIGLTNIMPQVALGLVWIASIGHPKHRNLRTIALTITVLEVIFGLINGVMKTSVVLPFLVPVAVTWVIASRVAGRWLLAAGLALFLVAYPLVTATRAIYFQPGGPTRIEAIKRSVAQIIERGLFDEQSISDSANQALWRINGIGSLASMLELYDAGALDIQGSFYLRSLQGLIPRFLWKDKPMIHEGVYFTAFLQGETHLKDIDAREVSSSTAITLFGSFFWNLGWPGLILSSIVLGLLSAILYLKLAGSIHTPSGCVYYLAMLPVFSTAENEVVTFISTLVFYFLAAWALNVVVGRGVGTVRRISNRDRSVRIPPSSDEALRDDNPFAGSRIGRPTPPKLRSN